MIFGKNILVYPLKKVVFRDIQYFFNQNNYKKILFKMQQLNYGKLQLFFDF